MKENLEQIAKGDGRYNQKALRFVYEGLAYTVKKVSSQPDHISGQDLCKGLGELAIEKWGRLAMQVLNSWQIKKTRDFGEIVYLLIEHQWLSAQPADSIDDFNDVYDFESF